MDVTPTHVSVVRLSPTQAQQLKKVQPEDWSDHFGVYVDNGKVPGKDRYPIAGEYKLTSTSLQFAPRYPFAAGGRFIVVFRNGNQSLIHRFSGKKLAPQPPAKVAMIYPSADVLPENLLKFYIHFSKPMMQGRSFNHIRLFDDRGKVVDVPFLELSTELWNEKGTRFTLFFDPGRIKRELTPRELRGPNLQVGRKYTLRIAKTWLDYRGEPMKESFSKTFRVVKADETSPELKKWKIVPPRAGTRKPLQIHFREPLDYALLHHMIQVRAKKGLIQGSIRVSRGETLWELTPRAPWPAGPCKLEVSSRLEDRCGNNLGELFEIDLQKKNPRRNRGKTLSRTFVIVK